MMLSEADITLLKVRGKNKAFFHVGKQGLARLENQKSYCVLRYISKGKIRKASASFIPWSMMQG